MDKCGIVRGLVDEISRVWDHVRGDEWCGYSRSELFVFDFEFCRTSDGLSLEKAFQSLLWRLTRILGE